MIFLGVGDRVLSLFVAVYEFRASDKGPTLYLSLIPSLREDERFEFDFLIFSNELRRGPAYFSSVLLFMMKSSAKSYCWPICPNVPTTGHGCISMFLSSLVLTGKDITSIYAALLLLYFFILSLLYVSIELADELILPFRLGFSDERFFMWSLTKFYSTFVPSG